MNNYIETYKEFVLAVTKQVFSENAVTPYQNGDLFRLINTTVTARTLTIDVQIRKPKDLSKVVSDNVNEQLSLAAHSAAVRSYRQLGSVVFEFQLDRELWSYNEADGSCIGYNASTPVKFELDKGIYSHVLVAGTSGSGKTEAIKTIITFMCINVPTAEIFLCDPKMDYSEFNTTALPNIKLAQDSSEIATLIARYYGIFKDRRENNKREEPPILLIIDEATDPIALGDEKLREELAEENFLKVQHITRQGRAFGCHVLLGVQRAGKMTFPGVIDNINYRFIGAASDSRQSTFLAGKKVGAELLTGQGDFLVIREDVKRVQISKTNNPVELITGKKPPERTILRRKAIAEFLNTGTVAASATKEDRELIGIINNLILNY